MTSFVTSADGTRIAFDTTGSGPALILVNGALAYRAWSPTLRGIAEGLADQYTVYNYDRRGRGESDPIETPEPDPAAARRAELDDLAALIEHAGGSAAVMGFSSGSVVCLEAALAGLPVTGLVLFEPPFVITPDRPPVGTDYRDRLLAALREGRAGDALALFSVEAANMPAELVEGMRDDPSFAAMAPVAATLTYDAAFMGATMSGDPSTVKKYAAVELPVLAVASQGSDPWLRAGAAALGDLLPDATYQLLPGQQHDPEVNAVVPMLRQWLPRLG